MVCAGDGRGTCVLVSPRCLTKSPGESILDAEAKPPAGSDASNRVNKGVELAQQHKYDEAIKEFAAAIGVGGSIPPPATPRDAIKPMARPDEVAALPSAAAATKTPLPLPANLLGQIRLKLISNDKGTLKFEVHNGPGWVCRAFPSVCTDGRITGGHAQ